MVFTLQSSNKFATVFGQASILRDQALIDDVWSEAWKVWFPGGKTDPDICLILVAAIEGEYWDSSGVQGTQVRI